MIRVDVDLVQAFSLLDQDGDAEFQLWAAGEWKELQKICAIARTVQVMNHIGTSIDPNQ